MTYDTTPEGIAKREAQREAEKAARAVITGAQDRIKAANRKLNRVSNPTSVEAAKAELAAAFAENDAAHEAFRELRRSELRAMSDEDLIKRHAGNANYSVEANMGDYSMGSINRARDELDDTRAVLAERGIDDKASIVWVTGERYARWEPARKSDIVRAKLDALHAETLVLEERKRALLSELAEARSTEVLARVNA